MGIFRRRDDSADDDESMDPQSMLERGHADMAESMAGPSGAAVDGPRYGMSSEFRLTVADVFVISGRGTVVTGVVESGVVRVGSAARVERSGQVVARTAVVGIEEFRNKVDEAHAGTNVGLLVSDLDRTEVQPGDVITN